MGAPPHLPSEVEIVIVQLSGRGPRIAERPYNRLEALVRDLEPVLIPHLDIPFVFFGHSMGGLLSFEIAHSLQRQQLNLPRHLFISGFRAPHLPDTSSPIHDLPEEVFIEELCRLNGTPSEVLANPELMTLLIPTLRADFELCETYVYHPKPPLECSITALGGKKDPDVSYEQLEGWSQHSIYPLKIRAFSGDHFYLNTSRDLLLKLISLKLEAILRA